MRTYSRKHKDAAGDASATPAQPLSPPKAVPRKRSLWSAFQRRSAVASAPPPPVAAAVGRDDDSLSDGEDEDEQQFLDLDPKGLVPAACEYCRMRYSRGVASDEAQHRRFCQRFRLGEKWPSGGRQAVVRAFGDGTRAVVVANAEAERPDGAARRVMEVVDLELGFAEEDAPGEGRGRHLSLYVLVSGGRAVAAIVTVPIQNAVRVDVAHSSDPDAIVMCCRDPEPAVLGISRVWVHRDHRRRGLGMRLLECVEHHAGVARPLIAFSQPTVTGRRLAAAFFGREDFLVFKQ